jgi:Uma2 family endonuclease
MLYMTLVLPPRRFDNGAEWLRALGGVPLERIIFDPWPGTATEADLLRFVERDKRFCELIDGTLVEKPVGWIEALIAMNLATRLGIYVQDHNLGAVSGADSTLRMASGRVRLPDVVFVSLARLPRTREPIPTLAPDLAVEVLSESNTPAEIAQKLREYFQSGTRLAWIVDPPTRTVAIYHSPGAPTRVLDAAGQLDGEQVVPGFTLPVADLFRNVPPTE